MLPKNELIAMRENAELFCQANLVECCKELVEWQDTALLRNGKLRDLASLCVEFIGARDALKLAERMVEHEACRAVANNKGS